MTEKNTKNDWYDAFFWIINIVTLLAVIMLILNNFFWRWKEETPEKTNSLHQEINDVFVTDEKLLSIYSWNKSETLPLMGTWIVIETWNIALPDPIDIGDYIENEDYESFFNKINPDNLITINRLTQPKIFSNYENNTYKLSEWAKLNYSELTIDPKYRGAIMKIDLEKPLANKRAIVLYVDSVWWYCWWTDQISVNNPWSFVYYYDLSTMNLNWSTCDGDWFSKMEEWQSRISAYVWINNNIETISIWFYE